LGASLGALFLKLGALLQSPPNPQQRPTISNRQNPTVWGGRVVVLAVENRFKALTILKY
jgi:hypothetical protein